MRAFDVLTKAEFEIRSSMQPRYHLEMALLRWLHLRKLVPLTDLIEQMKSGGPRPGVPREMPTVPAAPSKAATVQAVEAKRAAPAAIGERAPTERAASERTPAEPAPAEPAPAEPALTAGGPHLKAVAAAEVKDAFLGEIRKAKKFFYGTVVAQAQRIDVEADKVVFVFGPQHRALRVQLEQNRPWLEAAASQLAGRRLTVTAAEGTATPAVPPRPGMTKSDPAAVPAPDRQQALKERALSDTGVQTMLDVFAAEIKDVEEI